MASQAFIAAVGSALPATVLTNEQLLAGMPWLDTSAEWVHEHTGIRARHVARADEHATDLGLEAARIALDRAGVSPADTDLVILGTNTARFVYPCGAALIQGALATEGRAMPHAAALDLQQGCASFVAGLVLASAMVRSGDCRQVLVIGADVATRMLDWTDRNAVLLGDGAAACVVTDRPVVEATGAPCLQILGSYMQTVPDQESIYQRGVLDERNHPLQHMAFAAEMAGRVTREGLYARLHGTPAVPDAHFHMDGRKVYRFVRRAVPEGFFDVLRRAGIVDEREWQALRRGGAGADDALRADVGRRVDRFVPHGANMVLVQELADQMCIPYDRIALTLQGHGNTSAASVGIALDRVLRERTCYRTVAKRDGAGVLTRPPEDVTVEPAGRGDNLLLLSFGAGASWNYVATRAV